MQNLYRPERSVMYKQVVRICTGATPTVTCSRECWSLRHHCWSVSGRVWKSETVSASTGANNSRPARPTHGAVTSSTRSRPATASSRLVTTAATTTGGPTACRRPCRALVVVTRPPSDQRCLNTQLTLLHRTVCHPSYLTSFSFRISYLCATYELGTGMGMDCMGAWFWKPIPDHLYKQWTSCVCVGDADTMLLAQKQTC